MAATEKQRGLKGDISADYNVYSRKVIAKFKIFYRLEYRLQPEESRPPEGGTLNARFFQTLEPARPVTSNFSNHWKNFFQPLEKSGYQLSGSLASAGNESALPNSSILHPQCSQANPPWGMVAPLFSLRSFGK
jgi:hypothetical protein